MTKSRSGKKASRKRDQRGAHGLPRWLVTTAALLLFLATLGGVTILGGYWYLSRELPSAQALRNYHPPQTTRFFDRNGVLIGELFRERRTVVPLAKVPRVLVLSVLAAEDADFYHHGGMDLPGMLRVVIKAVLAGRPTQGGSTITQQVVKNLLLTPERTLTRKLKELILARRIEAELTKDEILNLYLNEINFGHGRYGAEEASRFYFGKSVERLTLAEASLIAGIPQSPSHLSPRSHPEAARRRQAFVLDQLEQKRALYWDDLPLEEIKKARAALPGIAPLPDLSQRAPEVAQIGKEILIDAVGKDAAETGGYRVTMSVDVVLEQAAREALQKGLLDLDRRHDRLAPFREPHLSAKDFAAIKQSTRVDGKARAGLRLYATYDAVVLGAAGKEALALSIHGVQAHARAADFARFNPKELPLEKIAQPGVRMRVQLMENKAGAPLLVKPLLGPDGAIAVVEPRSRDVLVLIGGRDGEVGFNRATQALRQPGSAFKPIVYAYGIHAHKLTAASLLIDAPGVFDQYIPGNYETWSYEGSVRVRHAIAQSINLAAVRAIDDLGVEPSAAFARELGLRTQLNENLALALGASEVRLTELVNAYATFAAGGRYAPLTFVRKIVDARGKTVKIASEPPRTVMTPAEAFVVTDLLRSVVEEGTGKGAKALDWPVAGKTGTSNQARDVWFVGYTPARVAAVWIGFDDHRPLGAKESGGKSAVPIWVDAMKAAHAELKPETFAIPSGVVTAKIDPKTGLAAYEGQTDAIDEVFVDGTVPTETARPPDVVDPATFLMEQVAGGL